MDVYSFDSVEYKKAYGISCSSFKNDLTPLHPTLCRVGVGEQSTLHAHWECELFHIVSGNGTMQINSEFRDVKAGDTVIIPSHANHQICNTSNDELRFLSVYTSQSSHVLPKAAMITAAPPTPNGPLHLGHIGGPYLAADVLQRFYKIHEREFGNKIAHSTYSHCGVDDHQNYVAARAKKFGLSTIYLRNQMLKRINNGFANFNIAFDQFDSPLDDEVYQQKVRSFAYLAIEKKIIASKNILLPFCGACDVFLYDAGISAICTHCGSPSSGACENCGHVIAPHKLLHPHCSICNAPASQKNAKVLVFDLQKHLNLSANTSNGINRKVKKMLNDVAQRSDLEMVVSFPGSDGITLPEYGQSLHVWFEMAANYYENIAPLAKAQDAQWIHCFGFDNSFYYLVYFPSLHLAINAQAKLPDVIVCNEFLLLEGQKFSTSREHAIWADEWSHNSDITRLYLMHLRSREEQVNFSLKSFETFRNDTQILLNKIESSLNSSHNSFSHTSLDPIDEELWIRIKRDVEIYMSRDAVDFHRASGRVQEALEFAAELCEQNKFCGLRQILPALEYITYSFMPQFSQRLRSFKGAHHA